MLWASTGAKNPEYTDERYVEELIGADTINTMPRPTMDAFQDHG
ncbi:MAG TPA: transaldolase family protein [Stellaceae bacterium]|nr:transaldolase family protein [Stellaceae bacterium]